MLALSFRGNEAYHKMNGIIGRQDPKLAHHEPDSVRAKFGDSKEKNCVVYKKGNVRKSEMETVFWFGGRTHSETTDE